MSGVRERYIRYYLNYARSYLDDGAWFDVEWPQIQRAWNIGRRQADPSLLLEFAVVIMPWMGPRGLWAASIEWAQQAIPWAEQTEDPARHCLLRVFIK